MELLPPIAALTEEDKGPIVIVTAYVLITETILFSFIKFVTNNTLKRKIDWDDGFFFVGVVLALTQTIITEKSARSGVGRFQQSLTEPEVDRYFKLAFAGNILSLAAQACAKCSVVFLVQRLNGSQQPKKIFPIVYACVLAWLVFSIFGLSFQCPPPNRWYYNASTCTGQGAIWYSILALNIALDAAISFLFAPTIWSLQITNRKKVRIASLFAVRVVVCGLTIGQIATLAPALRAVDTTRAMLTPTVLGQLVMNFSLLAASVPSLYRFLNELHSGVGFGGLIDRSQYELSDMSTGGRRRNKSTGYVRQQDKTGPPTFRPDIVGKSYDANVNEGRKSTDVMSKSSGHGSEDMIIKQTTAWTVTTYDRGEEVVPGASQPSQRYR